MSSARVSLLIAALLCVPGCKKETAEAAAPQAAAKTAMPSPGEPLMGAIAERLDAPGYTYLRLTRASQADVWVAVPTVSFAVGTQVNISNPMPMENFESKTLGRTFPLVMFGGGAHVLGEQGQPVAAAHQPAAPGAVADLEVDKATGADARTVAEIYAQRLALKGQPVSIRGKVVKVTSGVLDRNWLHLRDGSGSEGTRDFDLIVTTTANVQVDAVVTAQGAVSVDKDLGGGYAYQVLIEDATIVP